MRKYYEEDKSQEEEEMPLTNEGMAEAEAALEDDTVEIAKKDIDKVIDLVSDWSEPSDDDDEKEKESKEEARAAVRRLKRVIRENKLREGHESYVIMGYDKDDNDVFYKAGKGWVTENPTVYDSLDAANKDIATAKKDAKPAEIDDIAPVDSRLAESKKRAPKSWKEAKENIRKRLNEEAEELTDYQKECVQDMARMDFDVGHPNDDYDEIVSMMSEDEDLCDVAELAADYYLEITADGAPSFYDEFGGDDDNDFDEDDELDEDDEDFEESRKSSKKRAREGLTKDQKKSMKESGDHGSWEAELSWDDFSDPETDAIEKKWLPDEGEGETMMSQIATAVCKLIYKWFNDGDVFDTTNGLRGWANDLSSYANWLFEYVPETKEILRSIENIGGDEKAYTRLLYRLLHATFTPEMEAIYGNQEKKGTVYDCDGPFEFYEPPTCPECGEECDEDEYRRYGMCYSCHVELEQQEEEDGEEDFYEQKKSSKKPLNEDETGFGDTAFIYQALDNISKELYLKEIEDAYADKDSVVYSLGASHKIVVSPYMDEADYPVATVAVWSDDDEVLESQTAENETQLKEIMEKYVQEWMPYNA